MDGLIVAFEIPSGEDLDQVWSELDRVAIEGGGRPLRHWRVEEVGYVVVESSNPGPLDRIRAADAVEITEASPLEVSAPADETVALDDALVPEINYRLTLRGVGEFRMAMGSPSYCCQECKLVDCHDETCSRYDGSNGCL